MNREQCHFQKRIMVASSVCVLVCCATGTCKKSLKNINKVKQHVAESGPGIQWCQRLCQRQ